MSFLKHIGKHGDRKVAIIFRKVPQEDHMCLVIYPDVLPAHWHDAIMKVIESDMGQQANELADALHRSLLPDGRQILETLHTERMIKKVRTSDIIATPRPNSSVRLDELNKILDEMQQGEAAIKRLAEADNSRGLVPPETKRAAEAAYKAKQSQVSQEPYQPIQAPQSGALDDRSIAANMLAQAQKMEAEAKGLIAEAARMKKDAERMHPGVVTSDATTTTTTVAAPKKRGRPSKQQAVADAAQ